MNVSFGGVELSALGFALLGINGRGIAEWDSQLVQIPGRHQAADVSLGFRMGSTTELEGKLSADTETWSLYTHAEWLNRLDVFKASISPLVGYQKLIVTGDRASRYRWARFASMGLNELRPVFKLPFQPVSVQFTNHEPFWREAAAPVVVSTVPASLPNIGHDDARPAIDLIVADTIFAYQGSKAQPLLLAQIDDFQLMWRGTAADTDGTLLAGDVLSVDSEAQTVFLKRGGIGTPIDVIRYYDFGGPGAYVSSGFPVIKKGGSTVSLVHPRLLSLTFRYDTLYL